MLDWSMTEFYNANDTDPDEILPQYELKTGTQQSLRSAWASAQSDQSGCFCLKKTMTLGHSYLF